MQGRGGGKKVDFDPTKVFTQKKRYQIDFSHFFGEPKLSEDSYCGNDGGQVQERPCMNFTFATLVEGREKTIGVIFDG